MESLQLNNNFNLGYLHDIFSGITAGWDSLLSSDNFMSSRFGVISEISHSWMTLIASDHYYSKHTIKFKISI